MPPYICNFNDSADIHTFRNIYLSFVCFLCILIINTLFILMILVMLLFVYCTGKAVVLINDWQLRQVT